MHQDWNLEKPVFALSGETLRRRAKNYLLAVATQPRDLTLLSILLKLKIESLIIICKKSRRRCASRLVK